jgi:peroxiredoxin
VLSFFIIVFSFFCCLLTFTPLASAADGNGDFARKIGLTKETGAFGGTRSARYALIATNGVVDYIAVDEQGVDKTTADSLLANL